MKPHVRISMAFPCSCCCGGTSGDPGEEGTEATGRPPPARNRPHLSRALGHWRLVPGRGAVAATEWRAGRSVR
ncbi:hypothetical protein caldi_04770 [Caldinitratiruptor microaerophilus]|uniref:Uncharacterized protein n=1 Tax=Caldinitratiruptor microaerophilus TaxID=671077 RepID=A0AA35CI50_9FIRM|nr:hypothetical protein caldi_04770 [Caldinitratiruptor microaerophilus]